ncbi:PD-(D/E)XK nuclease superfamily protein [Succinivibrio dextrinosolvens]|uniref:PD-(D/E)XK nuclease superfamily protein n=1 Tax=Succinivibrio dextrinosolvens TaxID=83771 RepID=A0A662Z970_9GAMM|nr:AAA family ATPase [Succinivibrio dextrinosolvens]SFK09088.1 PD-(D/E)XK nuclease superfamily protein [Succinivibrio dextrinosolvens]
MAEYLNCNNESFEKTLRSDFVDKSLLLKTLNGLLNTESQYVCLTRPRRFGKSVNAKMINAYYSKGCDSKELFSTLKVANEPSFERELNKHNVINLDIVKMINSNNGTEGIIEYITSQVISELEQAFPNSFTTKNNLFKALSEINSKTGEMFIVIIDEWDGIFRDHSHDEKLEIAYVDFLRTMFKGNDSDRVIELAYITGILPIKRYNTQSALNNFREYTVLNPTPFSAFYGFTEDEVKVICKEHDLDFSETKRWYDGYVLGGLHMYNPNSIMQLIKFKEHKSYWGNTASFENVSDLISMNFEGLKDDIFMMLDGSAITGINTRLFNNDISSLTSKDAVITYLIHLGYLAYTDGRVYVPNEEVRLTLKDAVDTCRFSEYLNLIKASEEILEKTYEGDGAYVADCIRKYHSKYSSVIKYNSEETLSYVVQNAYLACIENYYKPVREMQSGEGFADILYIPKREADRNIPALVIELKWNKDAQTALEQIKEKHYTESLEDYCGNIILVGINYDKATKEHSCLIEQIKKSN